MSKIILLFGGIATAIGVSYADKENWFGNNPERKWWWQRPPFVKPPTEGLSIAQQAEVRRMVQAVKPKKAVGKSKYIVTAQTDYTPQPHAKQGPYEGYYKN